MLERIFQLEAAGSSVKREALGASTTFVTMAYILVVNPRILSATGMPFEAVLFATCVCGALATLLMGLLARYPIALAPGMGLNAFFAYVVVPQISAQAGVSSEQAWRTALGCVFVSGVLFIALALVRLRERLIEAVPRSLKMSIAAGIGMFIALIGAQQGGLVVAHPSTLVTLGPLSSPAPLLTLLGAIVAGGFTARGKPSAMLWTMLLITALALPLGLTQLPGQLVSVPSPAKTLFALDVTAVFRYGLYPVIFAFFFVDLFDTVGTLIGVAQQGGYLDKDGKLPRARWALLADAIGTLLGALVGTSTVTSYIESTAGIAAGARTGLSAVFVALMFLAALFFAPILQIVPASATAPVLIVVGALMMANVNEIGWRDYSEGVPAFLTIIGIAFTFSIADGIALGFVSYTLIKAIAGRAQEVSVLAWILALVFCARYVLVGIGH